MKFEQRVEQKYRDAIAEAARTILEEGNDQQREVARMVAETGLSIDFVPLAEINVSGNAGVIDNRATNRRIAAGPMSADEAMAEIRLTFSDWTFDVAGQRGCQGTLVHEGLHACDFARLIAACSDPDNTDVDEYDITLYELEKRAALISADYLVRIGKPDFIDDGLQLGLVKLDETVRPAIDHEGIERRMRESYRLDESNPGPRLSVLLGIERRPNGR